MNILLLGSQHGNELLGQKIYKYIKKYEPSLLPHITYKVGNPRAHKQNIRYIDTDLNRSYNMQKQTYESRRAKYLLRYIRANDYDLILDLHTTTCIQQPCFITPNVSKLHREFIASSHINTVVQMKQEIAKVSLIGVCEKAISVEVNKDEVTDEFLAKFCEDLQNYVNQNHLYTQNTLYIIDDFLLKTELPDSETKNLRNFQQSSQGFYPILVGENSYKKQTNYLGFKAQTKIPLFIN